jgi:hypothetical protein
MFWFLLLVFISIPLVVVAGNAYQAGLRDRHQACLESIARMEPELFPDLPKELAWVEAKPSLTMDDVLNRWAARESY